MILKVKDKEYQVPNKLTISKWAELQNWTTNDEYLWDHIKSAIDYAIETETEYANSIKE